MQHGTYSTDRRWWWDGRVWRPVGPAPVTGPPGLFWFFRTPGWARPFLLTACIALLPFVGQMVLYGWYLAARDNLRAGWRVLPRAGFEHLERGARPWLVGLVYGICTVPVYILLGGGLVVGIVERLWVAVAAIVFLLVLYWLGVALLFGFLSAAMFDVTDAGGIGAGLHPLRLWAAAMEDPRSSWRVFGALLLGWLIYLGIAVVTLPVLAFVPFGTLALNLLLPGVMLMAAPAQADFRARTGVRATAVAGPAAGPS
jgi:hypothetical protein